MADRRMSCTAAVKSAAPGLSDDDVQQVVEAILARERGSARASGDALRWREIAQEKSAEELLKLKIEKHARQAALVARMRRDVAYDATANKVQAISDRITTSERAGAGRAQSAEAYQHEARQAYVGGIVAAWQRAGVDAWLRRITPQDEEALAREIARLNGAKDIRATDSAEIRAAAEAVVGVQRLMREDANKAGAWVRELPGRVTRQAHDATRMQKAGFEAWRDYIMPRLDERTWKDADIDPSDRGEVEKLLRNVYNNLVSGNHHVAAPGRLDPLAGFKGPGSLARRLSEDRVLHFRNADDWLAYNRQFGGANLVASIIAEAEHGAKSIGLMRVWGPNPDAAWQQDIQRLADSLRDTDGRLEDSNKLLSSAGVGGKLWREWRVVTGEGDRPVSRTWANIGAGWRTLETITSLGGVVLSSIPDIATQASALRHEGVSYWRTLGHQVMALLPAGETRREVATRLGAGLNGQLGGLYHRLGYDTAVPGRLAKAADWFFRLNLQTWWQDAQERGLAAMLSNHVADNLRRDWAGMDAGLRTSLERFGVTEADWAAMRGAELLKRDGAAYFTPDMLTDRDARARVGAWFAETMAGALTRPGAYEKSILTGGQAPGTAFGEAARLLTQFKSYPLTFITKHWSRELHRQGQADFGGIAGLIAGTSILGYVSMTLKDLASGRNPRDPQDAGDWAKLVGTAMARGGGLGIYGDFLWGEYNRFGGGLASTAFGPAFGTAESAFKLFGRIREGEDPRANAIQFVAREALPTNLFYAKLALDHLVIHRLQEAVNPGYLRRLERRTAKENAQGYWLPPTAAVQ